MSSKITRDPLYNSIGIDRKKDRWLIEWLDSPGFLHAEAYLFHQDRDESVDLKADLIELLDASKSGTEGYTRYERYTKALYEYVKEEPGADAPELGRIDT